ncbi:hypothetical protein AB4Z54_70910, partial [Streptomyces sp. MCAF7]
MTQDRTRTWNRRRLLMLGGGAAAGTALGLGAKAATASESAPTAVPTSSRFDLTEPSYDLFR